MRRRNPTRLSAGTPARKTPANMTGPAMAVAATTRQRRDRSRPPQAQDQPDGGVAEREADGE
jgi:hypothetical protein